MIIGEKIFLAILSGVTPIYSTCITGLVGLLGLANKFPHYSIGIIDILVLLSKTIPQLLPWPSAIVMHSFLLALYKINKSLIFGPYDVGCCKPWLSCTVCDQNGIQNIPNANKLGTGLNLTNVNSKALVFLSQYGILLMLLSDIFNLQSTLSASEMTSIHDFLPLLWSMLEVFTLSSQQSRLQSTNLP